MELKNFNLILSFLIISKTLVAKGMKSFQYVDKIYRNRVDVNAVNTYFYAFEILIKVKVACI